MNISDELTWLQNESNGLRKILASEGEVITEPKLTNFSFPNRSIMLVHHAMLLGRIHERGLTYNPSKL